MMVVMKVEQHCLFPGANPYIVIKCENQKVRSPVQKSTLSAIFNTQAIFYQRNIASPIVVQVREIITFLLVPAFY